MSAQAGNVSGQAAAAPGQSANAAGVAALEQAIAASGQGAAAVTDAASVTTDPSATTENSPAALLAALLAGKGKAEPQTSGQTADPAKDSNSSNVSVQDPTLDQAGQALMQSMVIPAVANVQDKAATLASTAGQADASGQADAVAGLGQGGTKGQNLPNLTAGLAAQQAGQSIQTASSDANQGQSGTQNKSASDTKFLDVLAAKAGNTATAAAKPLTPDQVQPQLQAASAATTDTSQVALATPAVPAQTAAQAQTAAVGASTVAMQNSFGSNGWSQELGDKMVWMASNRGHTSELILNPPSLGTVEVRLHVNGNDAGAQFFSANPDVRSAIEAAMPKLREMLAGAGIALGEAMVSNQSFSQREGFQRQSQKSTQGSGGGNGDDPVVGGVAGVGVNMVSLSGGSRGAGLVDYYA